MSYSISAKRATKAELETAIKAELSRIPETQPVHTSDIDQAFAAAKSLIALVSDDPERDLYCSVCGSIWANDSGVQQVSVSANVNYVSREPPPTV